MTILWEWYNTLLYHIVENYGATRKNVVSLYDLTDDYF